MTSGETARSAVCTRSPTRSGWPLRFTRRFWHTRAPRCGRIPGPKRTWGPGSPRTRRSAPSIPRSSCTRPASASAYGELEARVRRAAAALVALGVAPGERVALALPSDPLYLELYFAAARIGAILVPLNTRLTAAELAFQLDDCTPRVLVRAPELDVPARAGTLALAPAELRARMPARASDLPAAPGGEAPQVILYTSGTTGQPKGAVLPHRKTYWNTRNAELYFELAPDSVVVTPIPLFHSFGLKILSVPALYCGATRRAGRPLRPARPAGLRRAPPRHPARRGARHVPAHARGRARARRSSRACASRSRPARRSRPRRSRATSPPESA